MTTEQIQPCSNARSTRVHFRRIDMLAFTFLFGKLYFWMTRSWRMTMSHPP